MAEDIMMRETIFAWEDPAPESMGRACKKFIFAG
jgi:hypothetical protein